MEFFIVLTFLMLGYVLVVYEIAEFINKNSIIDVFYGPGVLLAGSIALLFRDMHEWSILFVYVLATLWALRLAVRIFRKNYGKPEDARYAAWRAEWQKRGRLYYEIRAFSQIFILQGFIMCIIASPLMLLVLFGGTVNIPLFVCGALVWALGFFFEAVGDYQLDRHIANPTSKGTLMTTGLWAYTRHPNYFGEICIWAGIACIAASHMPSLTLTLLCFVSPGLIAYLLIYVSGIPMLEKFMSQKTGWAEYARKTPALVPWIGWK